MAYPVDLHLAFLLSEIMLKTEHYNHFKDEHEALNNTVKGLQAAFVLAANTSTSEMNAIIASVTPKWGSGAHIEPADFREKIPQLAAGMAIVHAAAIFETYIKSIEGYRASRGAKSPDNRHPCPECNYEHEPPRTKGLSRIERLFSKACWKWPANDDLLHVHRFFTLIRNCAAHRGVRASPQYGDECRVYASDGIESPLRDAWMTLLGRMRPKRQEEGINSLPPFPACDEGQPIPISGVHVIMFSSVNFWLAEVVEDCLQAELDC